MGGRINTIMQTCFFALSGSLPRDEAIARSRKRSRRPTASAAKRSSRKNFAAVDARSLAHLHEVPVPAAATRRRRTARRCRRRARLRAATSPPA
jgi:pyruvate-ferredoxin/flavodoxin oxidoreductase